MMRYPIMGSRLYILIFILFFLGSCVGTKPLSKDVVITEAISLTEEQLFEFKYQFFEANKYLLASNTDMAISLFNSCLSIDPNSAVVHYKLASIYLSVKDYALAEKHAEASIMPGSNNIWYLYLAGNIYTQNNNIPKAKETFNKLINIDGSELDFYFSLADVYLKDNDIAGALKIYSMIENKFGISEIVSLQKYKLYLASNNKKEAVHTLQILSDANPKNVEYRRMIADFYTQSNSIDEAIVLYNKILKDFPNDGFSHIGLAECYQKKGNDIQSFSEVKLAFLAEDVPSELKFNILLSIIKSGEGNDGVKENLFELTEILIKLYPDDVDINTIYANLLLQKNMLREARDILQKVVIKNKDKYSIWEQLILLDNQFQEWDTLYLHSTDALLYFPNQSFLYFFNGFSAFQLSNFDQAIKSLSFGFKLITKVDPLYNDFLTFLAESYYKIGDKQKCYDYFNTILEIDSENVMVLNNYAYYLSIDGIDLSRAEKMSKITITKEPNNATYLDTYAWILFKQTNYSEALFYIKKAIEFDSAVSDVVLEHYGDILFQNGKIEDAIVQWKKAFELGTGSGLLEEKILKEAYIE